MATTYLIRIRVGKDSSILAALQRTINYVENPEKTEKGRLVKGYHCDPRTAAEEFALDRRKYTVHTGRDKRKNEVAAYHLRQSFKPGEITPEEANRLGYELAKRFTKGKYAFIVSTHTERHHIHNHIIFNAVNIDCNRKFTNFCLCQSMAKFHLNLETIT